MPKISAKFDRGHTQRGRQMQVRRVKIGDIGQIPGYVLKKVQDRRTVSINVEYDVYALYRMVTLPRTLSDPNCPKPPRFLHFAPLFISS